MPPLDGRARHETVLDVNTQRIARVYAEALLRTAQKQGKVDEVLDELEALVREVFRADPQLEAFFASGIIGRDRKAAVLRDAFGGRADELVLNALLVLNDHERLDLLRPIAAAYRALRDQRAGYMRVQVRSAAPLPDDQRERLRAKLRETFHKEPVLEQQTDPELLGGMVVRVGDWVYDQSLRAQLENLRNQIIARSTYEIQSRRDRFRTDAGD